MLITQKGIFKFDENTKEIYLDQIHPGITVDDVKQDVPWDLKLSDNITQTQRPDDAEIDFIRHFAPGASMSRSLMMELMLERAASLADSKRKPN